LSTIAGGAIGGAVGSAVDKAENKRKESSDLHLLKKSLVRTFENELTDKTAT